MYRYPNPALQLSWLPRELLKMVPVLPEIVEADAGLAFGSNGCYLYPRKNVFLQTYNVPLDNGVIVIGKDVEDVQSVLAHEFRHHWQYFNTLKPEIPKFDMSKFLFCNPIQTFLEYYRQPHELDALMFEARVAPTPNNRTSLEAVWEFFNV